MVRWMASEAVGYVIVREDIDSFLINSQVIDLISIINNNSNLKVRIIWFYRLDYLLRGENSIKKLVAKLKNKNIKLTALPMVAAGFPVTWWQMPFVLTQLVLYLLLVSWFSNIKIYHGRSYLSSLACLVSKKINGLKIIFDPRSPLPEENVISKKWSKTSLNYKMWKEIERILIVNADATVLVSESLADLHIAKPSKGSYTVIPNNYPQSFEPLGAADNTKQNITSLVYAGSLGHWNRLEPYVDFLKKLDELNVGIEKTVFITPERGWDEIKLACDELNYPINRIRMISSSQEDVKQELSKHSAGMYFMSDMDPRLGVKVTEYLSAGIPIIVSSNIIGASKFVKDNQLGLVLNNAFSQDKEIVDFFNKLKSTQELRERCIRVAKHNFSPMSVAAKISKLYDGLSRLHD